jgi:ABC-type branched-subunit amino acid transport system substrate-binding protein
VIRVNWTGRKCSVAPRHREAAQYPHPVGRTGSGARRRATSRSLRAAVAVVGAVSLAAAGCGSSASKTSSPTTGASAAPIPIGLLTSVTGPASSTFADSVDGVKARLAVQNAEGGVDGRKLVLSVADDASTATQHLVGAEDLVDRDKVLGVISDNAVLVGSAKFLLQHDVPVTGPASLTFGEQPYSNEFAVAPYFQQAPSPASTTLASAFKAMGVKKVAILDYNDPQDALDFSTQKEGITAGGLSLCYGSDTIPIGSTNLGPQVLAMKSAGCQGVFFPAVESDDVALATQIRQAGMAMKQVYETGYDQAFANTAGPAAQNAYFQAFWPLDVTSPGVTAFLTALKKYDPHYHGGSPDYGTTSGWVSADLLIKGLEVAGNNPTGPSIIKNLTTVTGYTADGLVLPPESFNHFGKVAPGPQCEYFVQLKGSQFVPFPADKKPICGALVPS